MTSGETRESTQPITMISGLLPVVGKLFVAARSAREALARRKRAIPSRQAFRKHQVCT